VKILLWNIKINSLINRDKLIDIFGICGFKEPVNIIAQSPKIHSSNYIIRGSNIISEYMILNKNLSKKLKN
jgi:hypothetical protein